MNLGEPPHTVRTTQNFAPLAWVLLERSIGTHRGAKGSTPSEEDEAPILSLLLADEVPVASQQREKPSCYLVAGEDLWTICGTPLTTMTSLRTKACQRRGPAWFLRLQACLVSLKKQYSGETRAKLWTPTT